MQNVAQVHQPLKKIHFKNLRWQTANMLERHVQHHYEISRHFNFHNGDRQLSWIFESEIFNGQVKVYLTQK